MATCAKILLLSKSDIAARQFVLALIVFVPDRGGDGGAADGMLQLASNVHKSAEPSDPGGRTMEEFDAIWVHVSVDLSPWPSTRSVTR